MSRLPDRRRTVAALALLRERQWLLALAAVVLLSAVFVRLGLWQYHRHESKVARNALIRANYWASPVPLSQVLPDPSTPLEGSRTWTPVRVTGTYLAERETLVRNRPLNGSGGFEVLTPLRLADATVLVVDRGWVPAGSAAHLPDVVPAPPGGEVTVVVRLRPGESPVDREPPAGQQLRIDLGRIADQDDSPLGQEMYAAYGVLAQQAPAPAAGITLLPPPDQSLGVNLPYAVQWWGFAVAAYAVLGHHLLREAGQRDRTGPAPRSPRSVAPPRPVPARTRRRRSVDEEYEDRIQEQSATSR